MLENEETEDIVEESIEDEAEDDDENDDLEEGEDDEDELVDEDDEDEQDEAKLLKELTLGRTRDEYEYDEENEENNYDDYEDADHKKFLDDRHKFAKMMRKYLKIRKVISDEDLNKLKDHAFAGLKHDEHKKKEESQSYLLSIDDRVHMQDLESGLHLMLRSDIAHYKSISGVKLDALKEWLRVLTKVGLFNIQIFARLFIVLFCFLSISLEENRSKIF